MTKPKTFDEWSKTDFGDARKCYEAGQASMQHFLETKDVELYRCKEKKKVADMLAKDWQALVDLVHELFEIPWTIRPYHCIEYALKKARKIIQTYEDFLPFVKWNNQDEVFIVSEEAYDKLKADLNKLKSN